MYDITVPPFKRNLSNLSTILKKAETHAEAKKIDPAVLLNARLFPDMFPLTRQIQIASDAMKGCVARLAGVDIPKFEDTETTFADLQARITKTINFIDSIKPAQLGDAETRDIKITVGKNEHQFKGLPYLLHWAQPNAYFHITTTYNILRHNGVELGKADYLGPKE